MGGKDITFHPFSILFLKIENFFFRFSINNGVQTEKLSQQQILCSLRMPPFTLHSESEPERV